MAKSKSTSRNSSSKFNVPGSNQAMENMKYEIANEFGVNLGADATSRENGQVGGQMTKRLVEMAKKNTK